MRIRLRKLTKGDPTFRARAAAVARTLRFRNAAFPRRAATRPARGRIVPRMNTTTTSTGTAPTPPTRWTLDPGHSAVGFSVRHLMITNVRGEFEKYRAEVTYDPA